MVNEEDGAYGKNMYQTFSERSFTFSVALVKLNIKAVYFICFNLVKIVLHEQYLPRYTSSILFFQRQ